MAPEAILLSSCFLVCNATIQAKIHICIPGYHHKEPRGWKNMMGPGAVFALCARVFFFNIIFKDLILLKYNFYIFKYRGIEWRMEHARASNY
jgi:hypothetical protein